MFAEFQFEDIIFGIFPKVGGDGGEMVEAYGDWAKNSVEDIYWNAYANVGGKFYFSGLASL